MDSRVRAKAQILCDRDPKRGEKVSELSRLSDLPPHGSGNGKRSSSILPRMLSYTVTLYSIIYRSYLTDHRAGTHSVWASVTHVHRQKTARF